MSLRSGNNPEQLSRKELKKLVTNYSKNQQELINAKNTIDRYVEIQERVNKGVDYLISTQDMESLTSRATEVVKDVMEVERVIIALKEHKNESVNHIGFDSDEEAESTAECLKNLMESIGSNRPTQLTHNDISNCPVLSTYQTMLYRGFKAPQHDVQYCIVCLTSSHYASLYGGKTDYEIETFENLAEQIHSLVKNVLDRQSLVQERNKYRDIINNMGLGLLEVDLQERILTTNHAFTQMSGYERSELIGIEPSSIFLPDEASTDDIAHVIQSRFDGITTTYTTNVRTKSGEHRTWLISGSPSYNSRGRVNGSIGFHLDITEEKKRTEELVKTNTALQRANEELDTFVYRVSHDLRSPLLAVIGLTEIAQKQLSESNGLSPSNLLDMIMDKVKNLDDTIVSILHYSRNSRLPSKPSKWNLHKLLSRVLFDTQHLEKGVDIICNLNGLDEVFSDQMRWELIIRNLLANAVKYSDFSKEKSWVSFEITRDDSQYLMVFEDNGIGIAEDAQQMIFKMFYRASSTVEGSGLGLYIVDDAVKKLGGEINLTSELNVGTKIMISLPIQSLDQ